MQLIQPAVQKSSRTILPRRSAMRSGSAVPIQSRPAVNSGACTVNMSLNAMGPCPSGCGPDRSLGNVIDSYFPKEGRCMSDTFSVKFLEGERLCESTGSFRFERPEGYRFTAGQFGAFTLSTSEGAQTKDFSHASSPGDPFLELTT